MFFRFVSLFAVFLLLTSSANSSIRNAAFKLDREPMVRIGLIQNAYSVSIAAVDSSLIAEIDGEDSRFLNSSSVRASSSGYTPPQYELFKFEIPGLESREAADEIALKIRDAANTRTLVTGDANGTTFTIKLEAEKDFLPDAEAFVATLTEKGIEGVKIVSVKYSSPSDDAIALSKQIASSPKSKVRSLITSLPANTGLTGNVKKTDSSRPVWYDNRAAVINGALREVNVSGGSSGSISSLKPITLRAANEGIVRLNGKRYRGKMEVFANASGRITVVNVVPMEDYLLGVVPSELSLPQLEAQKAQAVAARTYAVANKNSYKEDGFDMLPTVWSQVYKGYDIETKMGTQAVKETSGIVATYHNKPINALYTSTCGGRTEDSGNIFEFNEPYLKGVNCALDGKEQFEPFLVKSERELPVIRNEANYRYVRLAAQMATNNYLFVTNRFDDDYFEDSPTEIELRSWVNQLASKFGKPFPIITPDSAKPLKLARIFHSLIYSAEAEPNGETLLSESDINYQLSFADGNEVPQSDRVMLAELLRDGWFSIHSDLTLKPNKAYSRSKILSMIEKIYERKNWKLEFEEGTANPSSDGKLMLKSGKSEIPIVVSTSAFLFRKFGDSFFQVKETALIGGEKVRFKKTATGELTYLEIEPSDETSVAEKMSPFTTWRTALSPATVRARLARYVKGMGSLIDVRVSKRGFSKRATELTITTTTGTQKLEGGQIRSALKLREQLFVIDKTYDSSGRATRYSFTGRGWGHGIGMCQYGAYGFAKMGLKYDRILKHYYTGIDLTKAY
ncbi:MAG: SpoIID/LytB domain-containing protein [Pyrinomonadaceae bacterium]